MFLPKRESSGVSGARSQRRSGEAITFNPRVMFTSSYALPLLRGPFYGRWYVLLATRSGQSLKDLVDVAEEALTDLTEAS